MPNSRDSAKRHRQNLKINSHNRAIRSRIRTSAKKVVVAIEQKNKNEAEAAFQEYVKLADTAVGKGIYHSNNIARKKSRMRIKLNSLG